MPHKPLSELAADIASYKELIEVGAEYTHYKDSTKTYTVKGFAIIEATNEVGVLYQANFGPRPTFVRPATEWLEEVDGAPRFRKS